MLHNKRGHEKSAHRNKDYPLLTIIREISHAAMKTRYSKIIKSINKSFFFFLGKKKMLYIYAMEYYSDIKKNKTIPFAATWMDPEIIIMSEVSQKKKDNYHMISLMCGI